MIEPRQGWSSLDPSLHGLFSLGRTMGLSDLGTYNPSSRLPGGGVSDHARSPALAFDLGVTPAVGMAHPLGRTFFEAMVGRPEVNYVILGDTIWSRDKGRHRYTAGGHLNHVHVSGVPGLVPTDRREASSSSGSMSAAQLAALWIAAGGNPRHAPMAAQVALLESGGRPSARALSGREDSRGLWQINVRAHPQYARANMFNPATNAQAAVRISRNGTNWGPWTTAGAARARVASGQPPEVVRPGGGGMPGFGLGVLGGAAGDVAGGIGGVAGDVLGGVTGVFRPLWAWGEAIVAFVTFVVNPLNWLRLAEVLLGFSLMLAGLSALIVLFAKPEQAGRAARLASPVGRAGAAAGAVVRGGAAA